MSTPHFLTMAGRPTPGEPRCCDCGRTAEQCYARIAADEGLTAAAFARRDGTYTTDTNRFCCDDCYVARGCPSRPGGGWKAP